MSSDHKLFIPGCECGCPHVPGLDKMANALSAENAALKKALDQNCTDTAKENAALLAREKEARSELQRFRKIAFDYEQENAKLREALLHTLLCPNDVSCCDFCKQAHNLVTTSLPKCCFCMSRDHVGRDHTEDPRNKPPDYSDTGNENASQR